MMCVSAYIGAKLEKDWRLEIRIRDFFLFRVFFVSESCGRGKKTKKRAVPGQAQLSSNSFCIIFSEFSVSSVCSVTAKQLVTDQAAAGHILRLGQAHDVEDGGRYVGEDAVADLSRLVLGDVDEGHGVE